MAGVPGRLLDHVQHDAADVEVDDVRTGAGLVEVQGGHDLPGCLGGLLPLGGRTESGRCLPEPVYGPGLLRALARRVLSADGRESEACLPCREPSTGLL